MHFLHYSLCWHMQMMNFCFTTILLGHPFLFQWSTWTVFADKSKEQPQASVKTFFANWQHFTVSIPHF